MNSLILDEKIHVCTINILQPAASHDREEQGTAKLAGLTDMRVEVK